jgi:nucleolar protein 12
VQAPPKIRYQDRVQKENDEDLSELEEEDDDNDSEDDAEDAASADSDASEDDDSDAADSSSEDEAVLANVRESMLNGAQEKPAKKRKRGDKEEVEDTYMRKLAREEIKEEEQRQKKRKTEKARFEPDSDDEEQDEDVTDEPRVVESDFTVPKHETQADAGDKDAQEVEKAGRTVFLGNVSTECLTSKSAEKALKKHLESFIADLADNNPPHKIESIRFRSTAFDNSLPKRAAFAKKEIMDSTTRSTNAYAVYTTKVAAREAVKKLNGVVFQKRHLHVDSLAHPTKIDHRRCVFVGNLPFVDDESQTPAAEGEVKKNKKPSSDIEEGLWTHFAKAGKIESVRVVRDAATRVGKGFAYVQFYEENGVEAALHYNEQKYPPMLPRKLRVTRCRAEKKNKKDKPRVQLPTKERAANGKAGYVQKLSAEQKSIQGRARSMLGKVAKAQTKEGFVFEGHRAKEGQGKTGLKFKGSGGKKKGPNGRKSRSSAWKSKSK